MKIQIQKTDSLKKEDTEVSTGDETVTDSDTQTKVTEEENQDNLQTEQEDQKKENKLNYLYINEAEQEVGAEQDILVSWGTEDENVDQLILEFENESGEQIDVFPSNKIDNAYLFQKIFDQGIYHVKGIVLFHRIVMLHIHRKNWMLMHILVLVRHIQAMTKAITWKWKV